MTHYRGAYRAAVSAALEAALADQRFSRISAWAQSVDPGQIPCFGVATPSETSSREGGTTVHRATVLQVAARVTGDEAHLETHLDDLSLTVEAVVLEALEPLSQIAALTSTSTSVDAGGQRRLGVLVMTFSVIRFTDAGLLS